MHRIGLIASGPSWQAGVEYIQNIISALDTISDAEKKTFEIYLLFGKPEWKELYDPILNKVKGFSHYSYTPPKPSLLSKILRRLGIRSHSSLANHFNTNLAQSLNFIYPVIYSDYNGNTFPCEWGAWIPDIQHKHYPQYFKISEINRRNTLIQNILIHAPKVIVSSNSTKKDVEKHFPSAKNYPKTLQFYTRQVDNLLLSNEADSIAKKYNLPKKYFVVCNQFWQHKNHKIIIDALKILKAQNVDTQVVCTGSVLDCRNPDYFNSILYDLRTENIFSNFHFLGNISRNEQLNIIKKSLAIIQPSLFEGWSTVVEDCRSLGKCILLSDIEVHREQNPPGSLFFNPNSPQELAKYMLMYWVERKPQLPISEKKVHENQIAHQQYFARNFLKISGLKTVG